MRDVMFLSQFSQSIGIGQPEDNDIAEMHGSVTNLSPRLQLAKVLS